MRYLHSISILGLLASAVACGPEERPLAADWNGSAGAAGSSAAGAAGSSGSAGESGSAGAAGAAGGGDETTPPIVDEPSTPCEGSVQSTQTIYAPGGVSPLGALQPIADGWTATAQIDNGFMLFDADGKNSTPQLTSFGTMDRVLSTGDGLLVASLVETGIDVASFDLDGVMQGSHTSLTSETAYELAIGRSADEALVVWSTLSSVRARALTLDGALLGEAFEIASGTPRDDFSAAMAPSKTPGELVVVWSDRGPVDRHYRTQLAFVDAQGVVGASRILLSSFEGQRVRGIAPIGDDFVVVVDYGAFPLMFLLDASGAPKGEGRRLLGAVQAFDLAVFGDEIMVSALRNDQRDALRRFDFDLRPTQGWICLGESSSEVEHVVSVSADSAGFAAIYRSPAGAQVLARP